MAENNNKVVRKALFLGGRPAPKKELTITEINKNAQANASAKEQLIQKVIDHSRLEIVPLQQFMNITESKIDQYVVDKFYHSIKDDIPIYLDNDLIKWCGYGGELKKQKQNLLELIKKYDIKFMEYDNNQYDEFWSTVNGTANNDAKSETNIYPDPKTFNKKAITTKHILIMPDDFRMIVMRLPTAKGAEVCRYYIELEKIIKMYVEYQNRFLINRGKLLDIELKESREERKRAEEERKKAEEERKRAEENNIKLHKKVDKLRTNICTLNTTVGELSDKLDIATDERSPPTRTRSKLEKFILVRLNDEANDTYDYYAIRAQQVNAKLSYRRILIKYPDAEQILVFDYHPNSGNLYNRIKEQMNNSIIYTGNYIAPIDCTPRGHRRFLKKIKLINNQRHEIELEEEEEDTEE
jgi:hypothetical protein